MVKWYIVVCILLIFFLNDLIIPNYLLIYIIFRQKIKLEPFNQSINKKNTKIPLIDGSGQELPCPLLVPSRQPSPAAMPFLKNIFFCKNTNAAES